MQQIKEYLPFLIPLVIIELVLVILALTHLLKHPNYRFGNKILWILVVVTIQIIGPVAYFVFGKEVD